MIKTLSTKQVTLVCCAIFSIVNMVQLFGWPIDVLPTGEYAIASSNLEVTIPTNHTMDTHLVGSASFGAPVYINSLMKHPGVSLGITLQVPNDVALYGPYAGEPLAVVGYLIYPTSKTNDRLGYDFPYEKVQNTVFPHMDRPGESPIPVTKSRRFPLIVSSHGHKSNGLWDLGHIKYLASHGYVALSIFHGDGRISDYSAQYSLRPLMTKAFIDYILTHPQYGRMIDHDRIGISGASFGGFTSLALLGGKYMNNPNSITDERIKAAFAVVPWVGSGSDKPFLSDFSSLENVHKPFLAVFAEKDEIAAADLTLEALKKTSGLTLAFELMGEGHSLPKEAWDEAQTLEILFFDSFLKDSSTTRQILLGTTYVYGEPTDYKVLQRMPIEIIESE